MAYFTQTSYSLERLMAGSRESLKIENMGYDANIKAHVTEKNAEIAKLALEAAKRNKPISVTLHLEHVEERTVTVDVPRIIKTGLFKKETVIEKETKTESYVREESLDGWILERFSRKESNATAVVHYDFWDYCLGKDGKLYVNWSRGDKGSNGSSSSQCSVFECLYNSPMLMPPEENVMISVFNGLIGALDTVVMDASSQSRTWTLTHEPNDIFTFDFPLEIQSIEGAKFGDENYYPYTYGEGVIKRLQQLLV
jgi:hypothetical protein